MRFYTLLLLIRTIPSWRLAMLGTAAILSTAAVLEVSSASAQSIHLPMGLQPSDEYRLMFVTEGKRNALSDDIAVYNAFVTSEANSTNSLVRGLAVDWFAIASTSQVDAIENTGTDPSPVGDTGVPIYLVDGASRVADHYDNWWDGDSAGFPYLLNPPNLTQNGINLPSSPTNNVWTGTDGFGAAGGPLGAATTATVGVSGATNGRQINNRNSLASQAKSFYAISSVLVAVPEPSATVLLTAASAALFIRRRGFFAK